MKLTLIAALASVPLVSFAQPMGVLAQQMPAAAAEREIPPAAGRGIDIRGVVPRWKAEDAPLAVPPAAGGGPTQLPALLRAQTDAIRALSAKIDSLEERVAKIEKKGPR